MPAGPPPVPAPATNVSHVARSGRDASSATVPDAFTRYAGSAFACSPTRSPGLSDSIFSPGSAPHTESGPRDAGIPFAAFAAAAPVCAPDAIALPGDTHEASANTGAPAGTLNAGSSASTTVLAASACREVKVASRNSCSAAAKERAEPSGISTSISHRQKFASNALGNSFERMPVTVMGIMPGNCVTRTRGSFGRSPESTTRENVRGPGLNASSSAPARRAIRPRDVASTTTFARIAWRPLRSAITMPHARPSASFSRPHGTAPVR